MWMIFIFFLQIWSTPDLPVLNSPTPYQTPTPAPTLEFMDAASDYQATATAAAGQMGLQANGNQITYNNRPLLPNTNSSMMVSFFAYMRWFMSVGVGAILGPFTPVVVSLGLLFTINIAFALANLWQKYITTLIAAAWFGIKLIIKLVRG